MSKWETIHEIPFFSRASQKTLSQMKSYIECMSAEPIPPMVLHGLNQEHFETLGAYLEARHSATWFSDEGDQGPQTQTVTSELIYYWMTAQNIPFECERWPLKRLMNLIKIASIKNTVKDPKKKSTVTPRMLNERAALNAKRRAALNSTG